ncbi:hypothetical protein [Natrinema sp. DC36]|uniref:hypothetical protein n=1 Tax=Natrinema sp. DC36 TaxID=2878680 RepID=UPI001CF02B01|nr:hypothetical protein [Natrinema sp. DC36]
MAASKAVGDGVVDVLLELEEDDEVVLEAEDYAWSSPYTVDAIEETEWESAGDGTWRTRSLRFMPTDARGSIREFDVVEGGQPPQTSTYGTLAYVERQKADDTDTGIEWLERPADEIVDTHAVRRSLAEVLDIVEAEDDILDVHQRFALDRLSGTRHLLWQLGLRNQSGQLLDEPTLQERIDTIREASVDE